MIKLKKKIIGLFGGSFDPPHQGHIKISLSSIKNLKLSKLYWAVTEQNPFKPDPYYSLNKRILKSKYLSKNYKKIKVISFEKYAKSSRTIDLIKYLIDKEKKVDLHLIIGSDNLIHFHRWEKWKSIVKVVKLVVFPRTGYDRKARKSVIVKHLNQKNILFIKNSKINISSTNLRKLNLR